MEKALEKLEALKKDGEGFTYENFSTKSRNGYPEVLSTDWTTWTTRVHSVILKLFGDDTPQAQLVKQMNRVRVLGNGTDMFLQSKNGFLSALNLAMDAIKDDFFSEIKSKEARSNSTYSNKVFIVHGHDDVSKNELEIFLKDIGLDPVVLHRQPDEGQTIIEKFERHSDVGYAFILLTPDEISYLIADENSPELENLKEKRARPNVIFEFGYFVGKLGRPRVCCLHTGDVTLPSDLGGVLYKPYQRNIEEVAYSIIKDLQACGYELAL